MSESITTLVTCSTSGIGRVIADHYDAPKIGSQIDILSETWLDEIIELYDLSEVQRVVLNHPTFNTGTPREIDYDAWESSLVVAHNLIRLANYVDDIWLNRYINRKSAGVPRLLYISSHNAQQIIHHRTLSNSIRPMIHNYLATLARTIGHYGGTANSLLLGRFQLDNSALERAIREYADRTGLKWNDAEWQYKREIALGRFGSEKDLLGTVKFLLGEDSSYITGQTITLDGGLNTRA